ncbi:hypothetical protein RD792_008027 [Penstemon davidsonii]|uniref:Ubiquitin thioesterase OTU n=1 Tax=Penstemon davidsonii TaxID=160366 RepID=A0ABR0D805_9LAMI|nr:hypothetical protein RD792_008027 [Penstemon davidsonii]
MMVVTPVTTCTKNVICLIGRVRRQMSVSNALLQSPSSSYCHYNFSKSRYSISPVNGFQAFQRNCFGSCTFKRIVTLRCYRKTRVDVSIGENINMSLLVPKQTKSSEMGRNVGYVSWRKRGVTAGLFIGLLVCFSSFEPSYAEAPKGKEKKRKDSDASSAQCSHGKQVLTDYSVIGIPGDGRCLFRSVSHGACIRSGKPAPNENLQRELADELRARVADEFDKRREETEWFIEGDFESYVSQIRKPHVWGGEPELLMASHVLQMPITVYMHDQDSGGLISIAEYGQEYGKDNPIKVLYHGFGHYDALHIPRTGGARPRL